MLEYVPIVELAELWVFKQKTCKILKPNPNTWAWHEWCFQCTIHHEDSMVSESTPKKYGISKQYLLEILHFLEINFSLKLQFLWKNTYFECYWWQENARGGGSMPPRRGARMACLKLLFRLPQAKANLVFVSLNSGIALNLNSLQTGDIFYQKVFDHNRCVLCICAV